MKTPFRVIAESMDVMTEVFNIIVQGIKEFTASTNTATRKMTTKGLSPLQFKSIAQKQANTTRLLARRINSLTPKLEIATADLTSTVGVTPALMPLVGKDDKERVAGLAKSLSNLLESTTTAKSGILSFKTSVGSIPDIYSFLTEACNMLVSSLDRINAIIDEQADFCRGQVEILGRRLSEIDAI